MNKLAIIEHSPLTANIIKHFIHDENELQRDSAKTLTEAVFEKHGIEISDALNGTALSDITCRCAAPKMLEGAALFQATLDVNQTVGRISRAAAPSDRPKLCQIHLFRQ